MISLTADARSTMAKGTAVVYRDVGEISGICYSFRLFKMKTEIRKTKE